jgi:uncharacterized protein (DUF362 family)
MTPFGMSKWTRRRFLAGTARVAAGFSAAAAGGCFPNVGGDWAKQRLDCEGGSLPPVTGPSRVVTALDDDAVTTDPVTHRNTIDAGVVRDMLDRVLVALAGGDAQPWPVLLPGCTSSTRIGLKVNTLNKDCPTSVPLVSALAASLRDGLGLPPEQIVVWDRSGAELANAGFTSENVGAAVIGTDSAQAGGYEGSYCVVNSKMTHLSRILTELTDLTINCPVLKTHEVSGVTGALKNVYGLIHNPGEFHDDLATALPAIYALEPVRSRIRLTVMDALLAITVGGTADFVDSIPKRIFASQDPLALDVYALALVNELRAAKGLGFGDVDPASTTWLSQAETLGLGSLGYNPVTV